MRARTIMTGLLTLALVAGVVVAPPAVADDAPPVGTEAPSEDGDGDDHGQPDPDGGDAEGGGGGDGAVPAGEDEEPEFGIMGDPSSPDPISPVLLPLLDRLERSFDFAEPRALYAAESFPEITDGSPSVPAQERPLSVRSVIAADLDGDHRTDVVSLVYVKSTAEVLSGLRAPGRAFVTSGDVSIPDVDPVKVGWYVVVHLHDGSGLGDGRAYAVGTEEADRFGAMAIGDVNSDDILDVVFSNAGQAEIVTLLGDGSGGFTEAVTSKVVTASAEPVRLDRGIAVGNVNGDAYADLVGLSHGDSNDSNTVVIMLGGNDGRFTPGMTLDYNRPSNVVLLDADDEGPLEILTTSFDANTPAALWHWSAPGEDEPGIGRWDIVAGALPPVPATGAWVGTFDDGDSVDIALLSTDCAAAGSVTCLIPMLNDGSGTFDPVNSVPVQIPVPDVSPWGGGIDWRAYPLLDGATADVDGDHELDIVIPGSDGEVGIVFGDGDGNFGGLQLVAGAAGWEPGIAGGWDGERPVGSSSGWPADWGTMLQTTAVAVGNVSGNAAADLIVGSRVITVGEDERTMTGQGYGQLAIVTATSPGRFEAPTAHRIADRQWSPDFRDDLSAVADWNGDGKPDLVFLSPSAGSETSDVMLAKGTGSGFGNATKIGAAPGECTEEYASRMVVADVIGDDRLDLVCGGPSSLHVFAGAGDDGLGAAVELTLTPGGSGSRLLALVAEDLDDDHQVDLVYAMSSPVSVSDSDPGEVSFGWAKKVDGAFASPQLLQVSDFDGSGAHVTHPSLPVRPVIADLTGDGLVDFAMAGHRTGGSAGERPFDLFVYVQQEGGAGPQFTAAETQTFHGTIEQGSVASLEVADLDGAGELDLILSVVNPYSDLRTVTQLLINKNDEQATFEAGQAFPFGPAWPDRKLVDLNGDGKPDMVSPTAYRGVELRKGLGGGQFGEPEVFGVPGFAASWIEVADVNGDGTPDLIGAVRSAIEWRTSDDPPPLNQLFVMINDGESAGGGDDDPPTVNLKAGDLTWAPRAGFPAGGADGALTQVTPGTVTLTVENAGTKRISGYWADSVWLSYDNDTWDPGDTLLFATGRTDGLGAGATLDESVTVSLAPPTEGTFYLIARVDTRDDIFEIDADGARLEDDNLAVAGPFTFEPPTLDVPTVTSPQDTHVTVTGPGSVVRIPAFDSAGAVRLTVTGDDVGGFAVRERTLPTVSAANQRVIGAGTVTLLSGDDRGDRYVLVDLPDGRSATLTASLLPFGVGSVSPRLVSTAGIVTLTVTGEALGQVSRAWAVDPDGKEIAATSLIRKDSSDDSLLSMTFDLRGQQPGSYGLRVSDGTSAHDATLNDAFTALAGRTGTVRTGVLIPSTLRMGSIGYVWVTFANDGLTDAVAPILRIRTRGVVAPEGSDYQMGMFYVSPEVAGAQIGVIPPGTTGRIRIPFMVDADGPNKLPAAWAPEDAEQYGFYIEEYGIDSIAPYDAVADFAADVAAELPGASEAVRDAVLAELSARLGDSGGTYLAALHRLRQGLVESGDDTADMDMLRGLVLDHAIERVASTAEVRGVLTDAVSDPVASRWMTVEVDDLGSQVRTDEHGAWSLPGIAADAGTAVRVYVDGYGPGPVHTVALPTGSIDVTLPGWGMLGGLVTDGAGAAVSGATVAVTDADGQAVRVTTGSDGAFRFDGIAAGSYTVTAMTSGGDVGVASLAMDASNTSLNLVLGDILAEAAESTVTGSLPEQSIVGIPPDVAVPSEVSVWVHDSDGVRVVPADEDGRFAVTGTAGDEATLWVFDAFLGVRSAEVTFPTVGAGSPPVVWNGDGFTVSIPVTLPADNTLPWVYLQPAATADQVPTPGSGTGILLVPSGLAGDPVTWMGGTGSGTGGTLSVADVPPGDYRVTVIYPGGGEDVAEFPVVATDVGVTFGTRPASTTASGIATHDGSPISGGFVELVSKNLTPARRYVAGAGTAESNPPGIPGAWSVAVVADEYDLTYYDASGNAVATGTYPDGLPFRGAGRALTAVPTVSPTVLGPSYLVLPPLTTDGDDGPMGGSEAELRAIYKAKFDSGTVPPNDQVIDLILAMPYPNQPPPDECKELDYSWLDAAKAAANTAVATQKLIEQLIRDTRKTKAWMLGEAALRGVMFLGEISNFFLGVIAIKQAVGKAAATAAAREEAKAMAAQGLKPPTTGGVIDLSLTKTLADIQTIVSLGATIYTEAKAAIYSAEPGSVSTVVSKVGQIGTLALQLGKELGYMAASTAVVAARELIGPIAAINNMYTQVNEASASYYSAIAQLDSMKSALDQLYVSYDFDLSRAFAAWYDFQANRFPEIKLDGCEDDDDDDDEGGGGGGGDDDGDGPKGPKSGPKPPLGEGGKPLVSKDPNEISGPLGVGSERWVRPGTVLAYRIGFENLGPGSTHIPEGLSVATAPAATVTVRFPLPAGVDIDSVELGEFGFGEVLSPPSGGGATCAGIGETRYLSEPAPGTTSFEESVPVCMTVRSMYDGQPDEELDLLLKASAWVDRAERAVFWEIALIDPATGLPHPNPEAGFLPPEPADDDLRGAGQGWANISFVTDAEAAAPVDAWASIVFDANEAIETNVWTNHLDGAAPTTTIPPAATTVAGKTVTVVPQDGTGSGVGLVDIWRSLDGGPLRLWKYQIAPGQVRLTGAAGQVIGLAARSTDRVGNVEDAPAAVQFTTTLAAPAPGNGGGPGSGESSGGGAGSGGGSGGADSDTLPGNAERIAGSSRYATAAAIAARYGTADSVIVANGEDYKQGFDALAANYLAGQANAPIVLTRAGQLPAESLAAICSVLSGSTATTRTIYVLGGIDTVSAAVAAALTRPCTPALGNVRVVRIGGGDRYETAALVATSGSGSGGDVRAAGIAGAAPRTAILASGVVNADALAAGAVAARFGIPVLLTAAGRLPQTTADALMQLRIERVIVLGGPDRVSAAVRAQLGALGIGDVITIAGGDRFETSAMLAAWARTPVGQGGLGQTDLTVAFANGLTGFPDALTIGPLLGKYGGVLLLAPPAVLPESLRRFLAGLRQQDLSLLVLGSPVTVADGVIAAGARAAG